MILSEASEEQLARIKGGLEAFCICSVQRINFHKFSMFFSSNITDSEAEKLRGVLGIPRSKKMGKYLGHHVAVDDKNRERHMELIRKVQKRVED